MKECSREISNMERVKKYLRTKIFTKEIIAITTLRVLVNFNIKMGTSIGVNFEMG